MALVAVAVAVLLLPIAMALVAVAVLSVPIVIACIAFVLLLVPKANPPRPSTELKLPTI